MQKHDDLSSAQFNNVEESMMKDDTCILKFQTTPKNSKEYNYSSHIWNCNYQLNIDDYLKKTEYTFKEGGWIQKDDSKTCGYTICVSEEFKDACNILYLIVIFDKILKGGKSKNPLPERSYPAGTEENWTMNGSPSSTNYVWSQIFRECIKQNTPVKFYIYKVPTTKYPYKTSEGMTKYADISPYEEMEKDLNAHLMKELGQKPIGEGKLDELHKE